MSGKKKHEENGNQDRKLRDNAEDQLARRSDGSVKLPSKTPEDLIHELQVHQIELEMQDEALEQSHAEVGAGPKLYDSAPMSYIILDRDGTIRQVNLTGARLLGMERGRLIGRRFGFFVSAAGRPAFNAFMEKVFASQTKETCEAALRKEEKCPPSPERSGNRHFGETGQIIVHIEAIASEDGQECRAAMADITDRKRAEETLNISLTKYRTLFESLPVGITVSDKHGKILESNKTSERLLGLPSKEHSKRKINGPEWRIIRPDGSTMLADEYASVMALKENQLVKNIEIGIIKEKGDITWVDVTAVPIPLEGYGVLTAYNDITKRKRAEEALRGSEEKFKAIFEGSHDAITITSENGRFIDCNHSALELFGLDSKEAFENKQPTGFSPPLQSDGRESREVARQYIDRVVQIGESQRFEWLHQSSNGEIIPTEIILTSYPLKGERVLQASIRDITERKRSEEEREKLQSQLILAQKMESVGRLAGGVAHDFNNMLGVILGRAEMMLMGMKPGDPYYADLEEILKAALRSADLTRQLLAFARKQTIAPKVLDLNGTVEGMLKMLRRLIGEDIDLLWKPDIHLWPVKMDPAQVDQILANLCVNARDAIKGTGKVTIEIKNVVLDKAYCTDHAGFVPGQYVMLAVSDNGCGMDKETQSHLFEPFFTTKEVGKGTGLGLATVYGIVKQNNGFVNVYSETGQGSTFKIYIPRHEGDSVKEKASGPAENPMGHGETILLVEDDLGILNIGKMLLQRLGYVVLAASSADEAVELAQRHPDKIHLLITDVVMPKISGKDLAKQMKILKPDIKILFMSGYTADVIAHRGILEENEQFIQKPFSMKNLAAKVRQVLGQK